MDFSGLEGVPTGDAMERGLREACAAASKLLDEYAPVEIRCERYAEKDPHPEAGRPSRSARFPWQRQPHTRVLVEISVDEKILRSTPRRKILHEYGEPLDAEIRVYALEEVVAAKLRTLLQHVSKLEEWGWSRSRARDYYDLWRVLGAYGERMELPGFDTFLRNKCAVRNVAFDSSEDFFEARMLAHVEKTWVP